MIAGPMSRPHPRPQPHPRPRAPRPNLRTLSTGDSLLLLAAFFASYHVFRLGEANLTFSDICLLAATLLYGAQHRVTGLPFGSLTPLWLVSLGLMLGGLFLGSAINGEMSRWAIVSAQYLVAFLLLPMVFLAQERRFIRLLTAAFVLGVAVMQAIAAFVAMWVPRATANALLGTGFLSGSGRTVAFVGDANWNGAMIAVALPLCIYCIKTRVLPRAVGIPAMVVMAWGLLLCASFTGFAAAGISTALVLLFMGWRFSASMLGLFAVASLVLVQTGAPLPEIFEKRVGQAVATGDIASAGTFGGRASLVEEALELTRQTTVVGIGVDQFRVRSLTQQPVHNLFLLIWTEGGLVALAGLVGVMIIIFALAMLSMRSAPLESGAALAAASVFLIYSMASPHMFARLHAIPLMLSLALIYGRASRRAGGPHPARSRGAAGSPERVSPVS